MAISKDEIRKMFSKPFDLESYTAFVGELFNQSPRGGVFMKPTGDDSYEFLRLMTYEDSSKKKLDVVVIKMKDSSSIERARTKQRNIISKNFLGYGSKLGIQDALIVFYNENQLSWRFSYIKQEFEMDENGKIKDSLTPAKRFSFFVNPDLRNVTVKQNFRDLLNDTVTPTVAEIETAFSVEAVTKEFFKNYVEKYKYILELFKSDSVFQKIEQTVNHGDEQFAENFVKKLLGQIVFIYFLQRKGWMGVQEKELRGNGNQTYLRDLYDECVAGGDSSKENGGINYFNDYLEWLFYDTLNKQRDDHRSEYFTTKIPYLNGGLFEPVNGYKRKGEENIIFKGNEKKANDAFGELLDVFDLFNFTVFENDPLEQDVAVDPEMLGKIFENLLPENERKGKGSFYTPRPIVHYMCKESLKQYLVTKTGFDEAKINELILRKDSKETGSNDLVVKTLSDPKLEANVRLLDKALAEVTVVDPAVGSGAFPMGMLKEIVTLREYINKNMLGDNSDGLRYRLKKEALQNSIYGVDIDPGAVEIAKLRFRLSLVVENDSQVIEALPNLDYKIMQGNSLLEKLVIGDSVIDIISERDLKDSTKADKKIANSDSGMFEHLKGSKKLVDKLKALHRVYFDPSDSNDKSKLKKEIDDVEKALIRAGCEEEISRLTVMIKDLEIKISMSGLELSPKEQKKLVSMQNTIQDIKALEVKFEQDNIRPFFPWRLHFGEIFKESGGFDIVIGNPPYVDIKQLPVRDVKSFFSLYNTAQNRINLYSLFIELATRLNSKHGILSYINPNSMLMNSSYFKLRELIVEDVYQIIKLPDAIFENATVETIIIICQKSRQGEKIYGKTFGGNEKPVLDNLIFREFDRADWRTGKMKFNIFKTKKIGELIKKIFKNGRTINDEFNFCLGITPYDKYRGHTQDQIKNRVFHSEKKINDNYVPLIKGKDIKPFFVDGNNISEYLHYGKHLGAPRESKFFTSPRLIVRQIVNGKDLSLVVGFTTEQLYHTQIGFSVIHPSSDIDQIKYLCVLLNTKLINFVHKYEYLDIEKTTFQKVLIENIKQFPFIMPNDKQLQIAIELFDLYLSDQSSSIVLKMNELVNEIYGLDEDEIKLLNDS